MMPWILRMVFGDRLRVRRCSRIAPALSLASLIQPSPGRICRRRFNSYASRVEGLRPALDLGDEQGLELFYNIAVTPWLQDTPDLQAVRPAQRDYGTSVLGSLRVNLKF